MSVRKGDRTQGKLQVLKYVRDLCVYTLKLCKNEKVFPKAQRWLMTSKIANEAVDAFTCIRRANSVRVTEGITAEDDFRFRRAQQISAQSHIDALLGLIDIAYELNGIESRRIEYWTNLAVKADRLLRSWMRSDKEKFRKHKK